MKKNKTIQELNKRDSKASRIWLKREHGITKEDFDVLYQSQDGKCKICKRERRLCIDHDHNTGKIRGLLCWPCNTVLGHINDDIEFLKEMIRYLQNSQ